MATYETTLLIPRSVEDTFHFVSNFQNAALWDPRTYAAKKLSEGPVTLGTRFMLNGGMLRGDLFDVLGKAARNVAEKLVGMPLVYEVVTYEPSREFELEGETPVFRYRDRLELTPAGQGHTRLTYSALLEFKGPLKALDLALQLLFKRIGDDATRDIPTQVAKAFPQTSAKTAA